MPSLVYAPVSILQLPLWPSTLTNESNSLGFCPPRCGDEHFHAAHRPSSLHMEAQAFYLHIGESNNSEATIWHEGLYRNNAIPSLLICVRYVSYSY